MTADEQKLKALFALELLKTPNDPFKAALAVEPNTGLALQMVHAWTNDPFVLEEKERLLSDKGAKAFLPSKEEYARSVYQMAENTGLDPRDRHSFFKLYGDIMGYIEKPGINIDNSKHVTQNRVMVVNNAGSNDDWERKLLAQQQKLINVSANC